MYLESCIDNNSSKRIELRIWLRSFGVCGALAVHPGEFGQRMPQLPVHDDARSSITPIFLGP